MPLPPRDLQGLAVAVFSPVPALHAQEQPGTDAVQLGIEELAARFLGPDQGARNDLQTLLRRTSTAIGVRQHAVIRHGIVIDRASQKAVCELSPTDVPQASAAESPMLPPAVRRA
jgi:hypothetical protein